MEALINVLTGGGASILGGLTGLFGSWITSRQERKLLEVKNAHDEKMHALTNETMKLEAELKLEQTRVEADAAQEIEAAQTFRASYEHDQRKYTEGPLGMVSTGFMVAVDFFRGMIRPTVTVLMIVIMIMMHTEIREYIDALPPPDTFADSKEMYKYMSNIYSDLTDASIYVATTVVLWWFGVRGSRKKGETK